MEGQNRFVLLFLDHRAAFAHVDTVQKLSDIFVLDGGRLLDQSSRLGHGLDVIAFQNKFVLERGRVDAVDARFHAHFADNLFTQKVSDFDHILFIVHGDVDGEVSVDGTHSVLVTLGHTFDHVFDVSANSAHQSQLLLGSEPLLNDHRVVGLLHVQHGMAEILDQLSARSLDGDDRTVDGNFDLFRDGHDLAMVDGSHCEWDRVGYVGAKQSGSRRKCCRIEGRDDGEEEQEKEE